MLEIAPRDEDVLGAVGRLARADGSVSAVKAIHELSANTILNLPDRSHVGLFPMFKFCWKFDLGALRICGFYGGWLSYQVIDRRDDSLGVEMPLDQKTVGG